MARILHALLMLIFAVVVVFGFFAPWVHIDTLKINKIPKIQIILGKQQIFDRSISGYDVPVLANGPDARLVISLIKIFKPEITDADKKSYLIWGIPGLAVLLCLLGLIFARNKWVNLALGVIGIVIFAVATYKIKTTPLDKLVVTVHIGSGLWQTLWGFLGLGITAALRTVQLSFSKKK